MACASLAVLSSFSSGYLRRGRRLRGSYRYVSNLADFVDGALRAVSARSLTMERGVRSSRCAAGVDRIPYPRESPAVHRVERAVCHPAPRGLDGQSAPAVGWPPLSWIQLHAPLSTSAMNVATTERQTSEPLPYEDAPKEAIVLLTSRLGMGGAERHTISLANLLSRRFRVVMAYLKPDEDMIGLLDRPALSDLRSLKASRRIDMRAARDLAELAARHNARAILCANAFSLMYAHLARRMSAARIPIVEVFHTTKLRTVKEHLELIFYRPFFWAADHLVFVCDNQRRYWRRRGLLARRTHMIYNGVDLAHFDPARHEQGVAATRATFGWSTTDRVLGICAVLRPEKAHADLIEAVARLHRRGQNWRVLIIGDGPMRESVENQIARLGLGQSVKITGFLSDVRDAVAACDVVALVSRSIETFSIAALEAMAMGKPMVMSDVGGASEQVTHGVHGALFPAGDIERLADCLAECWDPAVARAMGAAARERVKHEFSQEVMVDAYADLFNEIVGRDTKGSPRRLN